MAQVISMNETKTFKFRQGLDQTDKEYQDSISNREALLQKYENHPMLKDLIREYRENESLALGKANQEQMYIDNNSKGAVASDESILEMIERGRKAAALETRIMERIEKLEN